MLCCTLYVIPVKQPTAVRPQRHRESDGITQIIKIHTDKHRSVLAEIDDAIQAVLETGELPLFENGKLFLWKF